MPGNPVPSLKWPGTKNAATHRVWLPAPVQALLAEMDVTGLVFSTSHGKSIGSTALALAMRTICTKLSVADKVTPHDLRRTHGTTIASMGFGRDAMNRVQNHKEGGIGSVYDRHGYGDENKRIMETVAARILLLARPATSRCLRGKINR